MPIEPSRRIGRCHVLRRAVEGVMVRLSFLEHHTLQPGGQGKAKPMCLRNADYTKMRRKLEVAFPDPDAAKATNFDSQARAILGELEGVFQVFEDVVEVRNGMAEELGDMAGYRTGMTLKFAVDVNPDVMMSFMSLMADYIRLHLVVASVTEKKQALGMYYCAHAVVHGKSPAPSISKVNALIAACDNPLSSLANELGKRSCDTVRSCIAGALTAIKEVVDVASEVKTLRGMNALSVLDEGDLMPFPCQLPVSQRSTTVMLHSEMLRYSEYVEWVCLMGLVIPQTVLSQAELMELWTLVCKDSLIIPIFRDVTLNVHAELEKMALWFPPKNSTVTLVLPDEVKLKKYVKGLGKDAASQCALRHRERRAYAREQIRALAALVQSEPGMLGPKLPMVLAACKMAKGEVIWYCQHTAQSSGKGRSSKTAVDPILPDPMISVLIGELDLLVSAVKRYSSVVQRYYAEYLSGAHLTMLRRLVEAAIDHTNIRSKLSKDQLTQLRELAGPLEKLDPLQPEQADLKAFRWDCSKLLGVLSEPDASLMNDLQVSEMMRRMTRAMEHSNFVDGLEDVLREHCDLSETWWYFESVLKEDAERCLNATQDSSSKFVASYIKMLGSAVNNVHEDCPDEQLIIGAKSADLAEKMAESLASKVERLVRMLCHQSENLQRATLPQEAANRAHRQQEKARRLAFPAGRVTAIEGLPGQESDGSSNNTVDSLTSVQRNLSNLLTSINTHPSGIVVFDRLIVPKEYVREMLEQFVRKYLYSVTVFDGGVVERPTVALRKLLACSAVLQGALARTSIDAAAIFRQVLLEECTDWAHIHAKTKQKAGSEEDGGKAGAKDGPDGNAVGVKNVLDHISRWYVYLLRHISPGGKGNGIVFVPARLGFVASSEAACGGPPVDMFFDLSELKALCTLLGSGGARAVEKSLLDFVAVNVREIQLLLVSKMKALEEFREAFSTPHWEDALKIVGGLDTLVKHAIAIGNALTLRRLLNEALAEVYQESMPFLRSTVDLGGKAVDAGAGGVGLETFKRLAGDFGVSLKYEDHSLLLALDGCIDHPAWSLLPYAFAASFSSVWWQKCEYVSRLGVFKNNEHVMVTTILELTEVFFGGGGVGVAGERGPGGNGDAAVTDAFKEYVRVASFVLLRLKLRQRLAGNAGSGSGSAPGFKFFCMYAFLDKFVEECQQVDRSVLEEFVPQALVHAGYLHMSRKSPSSA